MIAWKKMDPLVQSRPALLHHAKKLGAREGTKREGQKQCGAKEMQKSLRGLAKSAIRPALERAEQNEGGRLSPSGAWAESTSVDLLTHAMPHAIFEECSIGSTSKLSNGE